MNTNSDIVPARWHEVVNGIIITLWGIILPILICLLLTFGALTVLLITVVWFIANMRLLDRYLPRITGPMIDRIYAALHKTKSPNNP
jgi:hypothetical protein